jgi:hypothetical protein
VSDHEAMKLALEALKSVQDHRPNDETNNAITALRARLAAPRPEPSGYAYRYADGVLRLNDGSQFNGGWPVEAVPYWFAPPAAAPEPVPKERAEVAPPARGVGQLEEIDSFTGEVYPEKRHPGYLIGNHWLETAYERLCAGEAEDAILEDYEVVREPRLRELRRDAERYQWLLNWLVKTGLLTWERCRIDSPASFGDWWILRKPKVIDGSALIGYGKTEDAAIDAAVEPATEPAIRARGQEVPR